MGIKKKSKMTLKNSSAFSIFTSTEREGSVPFYEKKINGLHFHAVREYEREDRKTCDVKDDLK